MITALDLAEVEAAGSPVVSNMQPALVASLPRCAAACHRDLRSVGALRLEIRDILLLEQPILAHPIQPPALARCQAAADVAHAQEALHQGKHVRRHCAAPA